MGASTSVGQFLFHCCSHNHVEKWEDNYRCTDCCQEITDPVRLQKEKYMETFATEDAPSDGVSRGKLSQLRGLPIWWIVDWTVERDCWALPTWRVRRDFILPETNGSRSRYVDLPKLTTTGLTGPATTYICHSWGACWGDLVAALCDGNADRNRRVWIDLFAVRQWPSLLPDFDAETTICECSAFMLIFPTVLSLDSRTLTTKGLSGHNRDPNPFRRLWCLYELHIAATIARSKDMSIIFKGGAHCKREDGKVLYCPSPNILSVIARSVDVATALTTKPSDAAQIRHVVKESPGGIMAFNRLLEHSILGGEFAYDSAVLHCAACGDTLPLKAMHDDVLAVIDAAASGYCGLLTLLLESPKFDVNIRDKLGWTALMHAAKAGHITAIETLLDNNADHALVSTENKWTALMFAAVYGHAHCIEYLLMEGAAVDARAIDGSTALMYAGERGFVDCARVILDHDVSTSDMTDTDGQNALMLSAQAGQSQSIDIIANVGGARMDERDNRGYTALIYATILDHVDCIDALLDAWAAVDFRDFDGKTALMFAAVYGHVESATRLLDRGSSVNAQSKSDWTALMYASKFGHVKCVELLVRRGANVNIRARSGWTALVAAAESGHTDCVKVLRNAQKEAGGGGAG
jgi:ankyrin repeat protein